MVSDFPRNPQLECQEFKTNYHMSLFEPIVNMSTCPIPSFLLVQCLCCFHVPLTSNLV
jgi:hypothetical protein